MTRASSPEGSVDGVPARWGEPPSLKSPMRLGCEYHGESFLMAPSPRHGRARRVERRAAGSHQPWARRVPRPAVIFGHARIRHLPAFCGAQPRPPRRWGRPGAGEGGDWFTVAMAGRHFPASTADRALGGSEDVTALPTGGPRGWRDGRSSRGGDDAAPGASTIFR